MNGRIKQSVAFWCFNVAGDKWDLETTCRHAKELGCAGFDLVPPEDWGTLKKHGLISVCAPNGMPGAPFMKGLNNLRYHEQILTVTKKTMEACAEARFPSVIAFTGYQWRDADDPKSGAIGRDEGAANCVKGLKELAGYAEKHKVDVCLEHLNTRDASHPMKGHPGYQGDDVDWVAGIVRKVGSPRIRLLFDVFHVQMMHGDIIHRIEENNDVIGHVHVAGCPGRGELDETQEINYPAVMRKLLNIGYNGYVAQEFIPTRNALEGLRQAVQVCDV